MYLSDPLARQFYMQMCYYEHWDTRTLDEKISSQLYERTAISRRPEEVIKATLDETAEKNMLVPDKKILAEKLQRAIAIAREHYAEQ